MTIEPTPRAANQPPTSSPHTKDATTAAPVTHQQQTGQVHEDAGEPVAPGALPGPCRRGRRRAPRGTTADRDGADQRGDHLHAGVVAAHIPGSEDEQHQRAGQGGPATCEAGSPESGERAAAPLEAKVHLGQTPARGSGARDDQPHELPGEPRLTGRGPPSARTLGGHHAPDRHRGLSLLVVFSDPASVNATSSLPSCPSHGVV